MRRCPYLLVALSVGLTGAVSADELPASLRVVLEQTSPLPSQSPGRLPLYVLPITGSLAGISDAKSAELLGELDARGIGYTVDWKPASFAASLAEGLRIGALQQRLGMRVSVNANACLTSFFDQSDDTLHVDEAGKLFSETSFGGELGCPLALQHRLAPMKERVAAFLRAYQQAGVRIDLIFADWEVDGPIEWNDAWTSS